MKVKLLDGAMGTILLDMGFTPPFEDLNITHPEIVKKIHQDYLAAGSEVLLTHTFAAKNLTQCEGAWNLIKDLPVRKLISIGPEANISQLVDFFKDKGQLVFETIYQVSTGEELIEKYYQLQPIYSFSLRARELKEIIPLLIQKKIKIIGLNCLNGLEEIEELLNIIPRDFEIYLKPNTGTMKLSANQFASELMELSQKFNITYLGGCCGTTPLHIQQLQKVRGTFWP